MSTAPDLASLFAHIDALAAQATHEKVFTYSDDEVATTVVPSRLVQLGESTRIGLIAETTSTAAAPGTSPANAIPTVNNAAPAPAIGRLDPLAYAYDAFLDLNGAAGRPSAQTSSTDAFHEARRQLFARQEVWDDVETGDASMIRRSDAIYDMPGAPALRRWQLTRDTNGCVSGFTEEAMPESEWWRGTIATIGAASCAGAAGSSSSSLLRPLASKAVASTGSVNFVPFRPGGLDDPTEPDSEIQSMVSEEDESAAATLAISRSLTEVTLQSLFPWDHTPAGRTPALLSKPPGFERGLRWDDEQDAAPTAATASSTHAHQLATQKARDAAAAAHIVSSGSKLPSAASTAAVAAEPYVAGVNEPDILADVSASFTDESYAEYRAQVRAAQSAQLARTELKMRHVSEEIDEDLFADEDEQEQRERLAQIRDQKQTEEEKNQPPGGITEDDLLAELDITLPSASTLREETAAAAQARLNHARNLWATTDRLDVSNFHQQLPNMAIRYPFELDTFQKEAILHIERGESVFVAAHTSAGKTVVAEYAIALAAKHLTRAIYSSPIKTLSNQKFREFRKTFGEKDVGIITGDVSINPDASCLILTTEILRSMLYKGADLIRDIEWVVFDEVHYINDLERGVVWEEVIIMLPAHVNFVLLSATVPNTLEFADWVGRTRRKNIHVIATDKRPVPLQHFLWAKNKLFGILDGSTGKWNSDGFKNAKLEGLTEKKLAAQKKGIFKKPSLKQAKSSWIVLIKYLEKQDILPVVIFAFSKRICEDLAFGMYNMDLTTSQEKSEITIIVQHALNRLSVVDRRLPQVLRVKDLVRRGIGLHHAGILPILKETVEMLFSRGLIRVLFATETFAMGVNFPTRSVVFYDVKKHDGRERRDLLPGEYTQMSGRAGRRGLDKFGIVIINALNDHIPEEMTIKQMLLGRPTKLESRFRLTYNMILNLLRQEDMKVEEMIKRSFGELVSARDTPVRKTLLAKGERKLKHMRPVTCELGNCTSEQMQEYFHLRHSIAEMTSHLFEALFHPSNAALQAKYLCVGRTMVFKLKGLEHCAAVVLRNPASSLSSSSSSKSFVAFVLVPPGQSLGAKYVESAKKLGFTIGQTTSKQQSYIICEFGPTNIVALLADKLEVDVAGILVDRFPRKIDALCNDLLVKVQEKYGVPISAEQAAAAGIVLPPSGPAVGGKKPPLPTYPKALLPSKLPPNLILDPLPDMKLNTSIDERDNFRLLDEQYLKVQYQQQLAASPVNACPHAARHQAELTKQHLLREKVDTLRRLLSNQNLDLLADFENRMRVLQHLRYVDAQDRTVQLKGRVQCEINTCPSLLVTELIFENVLTGLEPEEIVSLLSCLIFQEKNADDPVLTERLTQAKGQLDRLALALGQLQLQCGLDIVPEDFVQESINWGMMSVVYEWAKGMKFADITQSTNVLEGSIVRCITRLDETCRDVRNAARVIGDAPLYQKMMRASELIKRDIVFAASLYVA